MVASYFELIAEIDKQLATLIEKHSKSLSYGYFALDEQLVSWLQLALNLTENTFLAELNYLAPCLMLYICSAVGGNPLNFIEMGAAIQFMHKASAILDDIQDQDSNTSLVNKLGPGEALNLALILINFGQITFHQYLEKLGHPIGDKALELTTKLLQSMTTGLRGQLLDLQDKQVPLEQRLQQPEAYLKKVAMKTALTSSYLAELGAILGGAEAQTVEVYRRFGFAFGLALHLLDDLQDFLRGMRRPDDNCDVKNGYLSLTIIYAFQELSQHQEISQLRAKWGQVQETPALLEALYQSRVAVLQTLTQVTCYLAQAEQELKRLDANLEKIEHQILMQKLKDFARSSHSLYIKYYQACS